MYYTSEEIERVRQIDLLTYLQCHEPDNLRRVSPGVYCTREHDSLRISNGKWYWFSQGIGGCSALDYLVKVRNIPFMRAVETLTGQAAMQPPIFAPKNQARGLVGTNQELILPRASPSSEKVTAYLLARGISLAVITHCLRTGLLYESLPYHNAVFEGFDPRGQPRYAALRGIGSDFKGEAPGSDKRFSFSIPATDSTTLHLFEGAVDLLSYATMVNMVGYDWHHDHLLSLGGVSATVRRIPPALGRYLHNYKSIQDIYLRLDNDDTGRRAAAGIRLLLKGQYRLLDLPPPYGKDYNDWLHMRLGKEQNHD